MQWFFNNIFSLLRHEVPFYESINISGVTLSFFLTFFILAPA